MSDLKQLPRCCHAIFPGGTDVAPEKQSRQLDQMRSVLHWLLLSIVRSAGGLGEYRVSFL